MICYNKAVRGYVFCAAALIVENKLRNTHYGNCDCQKFSHKTKMKKCTSEMHFL